VGSKERGGESPTRSLLDRLGSDAARSVLVARYFEPLCRWARLRSSTDCAPELIERCVRQGLHQTIDELSLSPSERSAFHWRLREAVQERVRRATPRGATPSALAASISESALARYDDALRQMSEADREMVVTRIELGFSREQMAELLGVPDKDEIDAATSAALVDLARRLGDDAA